MGLKQSVIVVLAIILSLFAYACSDDNGGGNGGKDATLDVTITDVVTDTSKVDAGKDVSPDISEDVLPDVSEDVLPDVSEDVLPDVSEDVLPDVGEDAGTDVVDVGPEEHKYNAEEPDSFDKPNKVELNAEISGQIDEPVYDPQNDYYKNDLDFFEFEAKAGDIIRLEAKALENMDIVPVVILVDSKTGGSFLYRVALMNMDNNTNAAFTAFIPRDGRYLAVVGEYTNFGQNPANVGGEKYKYTLTIKYSSLDRETLDLSSVPKKVSKAMPVDMPDIFSFNVAEEKYIKAETSAVRLATPSEVNTVVTLFNADKKEFIELADDIDADNGITDSLLLAYTGGSGNFYLIVEAIIYTNQKTDYDLDVDFLPMDVEVEPNDSYTNASAMRIPSETSGTIGEPKDGKDENGNPIKIGDLDNFYFYGKPGELYRFSIVAENGSPSSPLDSYLIVYQVVDTILGPYPVVVNLNDNSNGKDSMVEALISEEGKYYVAVMDTRNTSDNPNPVGGADYKYKIKAEKVTLSAKNASSMPYSDSGALEPAGAYKFYKFSGVKADKFTIDVYQASGSDPNFTPFILLYNADTYQVLDGTHGDDKDPLKKATLNYLAVAPANLMVAILDYNGEGGANYKYTIDIKKVTLPYYDEKEPNDDLSIANEVKESHSLYFGTLDGDGEGEDDLIDLYKFTGSVGQILNVALYGGPAPEVKDTKISILDSDGNELASNEDYGSNYYSAIYSWAIPFDGTFYIKVEAQIDYGPVKGSYVLEYELINGCLTSNLSRPLANELVINEFYPGALKDANNDGNIDEGDQFVEIVNTTEKDLLIELVELKVDDNTKIKFPCGTTIPAKGAIVVFGGGKPDGSFGVAQVYIARGGLAMPKGSQLTAKISINYEPVIIDEYSYDANSSNVDASFTRNPDITGDFTKHSDIPEANGALFSPGTRVNGVPFVNGYGMLESEPNNDISTANTLPPGESRIIVFGNLKYVQGAQDNDLDDYFKITLLQGQKITIYTEAGFAPEVTDTTLVLFNNAGDELARNEDIDWSNYYSKIADFEIPSDGDYYIDVKAETNYGDLPGTGYKMVIEIK
ncbi:MAG: pre-peptidase C-terminal domain-containing protein [Myxococcota bacterium]